MNVIFYNGDFISEKKINISHRNRAFNYGDGFFETIKVINSIPFNLNAHLKRIKCTSELLSFDKIDLHEMVDHFNRIIEYNNIIFGVIKLHVSRVEGGLYLPHSNNFNIMISIDSDTSFKPNKSVNLCFYKDIFKPTQKLSNLKSVNSLTYVLAAIYAKNNNYDDAILFNSDGNIIETSNSNIFVLKNNIIYTPPLKDGCLNGTMRNWVLTNNEIQERSISDDDIITSDEVFISNAKMGLVSVKRIEHHKFLNNSMCIDLQNKLINLSLDL